MLAAQRDRDLRAVATMMIGIDRRHPWMGALIDATNRQTVAKGWVPFGGFFHARLTFASWGRGTAPGCGFSVCPHVAGREKRGAIKREMEGEGGMGTNGGAWQERRFFLGALGRGSQTEKGLALTLSFSFPFSFPPFFFSLFFSVGGAKERKARRVGTDIRQSWGQHAHGSV